ncbi:flagellin [Bacillus sp. EB106-08-02-XG196]|jgi:flagellin|uniref:flagellin N-terminal helical domain-containing protein n=1 Tax=Bacillus sp. EB106-08-02-XG196 TaxID=2737049 RepID=UPI0015C465F0|nr:flagellin [Bacillus sp. EB106-08-02-XG196]NWQ39680.1 flagellin [Bacillus sp. EB106-08-02-XG196]
MRINTNVAALNTHRQLTAGSNAAAKNMERLSSGLRINRASDDAAGLAISEKMRGQIRGLEVAQKNAQNGVSLLQTAEGALNETHSILQRMRELAVQSANDTNTSSDRVKLQAEIDTLAEEVGRIGSSAEFNGKKLLNGSFDGTFQIGANQDQNMSIQIGDAQSFSLGVAGKVGIEQSSTVTVGGTTTGDTLKAGTYSVSGSAGNYEVKDENGKVVAASTDGLTFTTKAFDGTAGDDTFTFSQAVKSGTLSYDGTNVKATASFDNTGLEAGSYTYNATDNVLLDTHGEVVARSTDGIAFKGDEGTTVFTATVALTDGDDLKVGGADISTQAAANTSITAINTAIETVAAERSKMGAVQNRLEFTNNSLSTTAENLTSAESRIRDVDMAKEMMTFTKNNILSQAAQAMLSQANQQPQAVLQLLR